MPETIDLNHLAWWLLAGFVALASTIGLKFLGELTRSVKELNTNVALVVDRQARQGEVIDDHEERLRDVESLRHAKLDA
jgi:hypothetical protein